jgi:hypothetical protein
VPPTIPLLSALLAVQKRLHSMIVERVWLDQVDNVELVGGVAPCVGHSKKEPLAQLLGCSIVKLQFEVIFKVLNLRCSVQVA